MIKTEFEKFVENFLKQRTPFGSSNDSDIWRREVLQRYYRFGKMFNLTPNELYSRSIFGLWYTGGMK